MIIRLWSVAIQKSSLVNMVEWRNTLVILFVSSAFAAGTALYSIPEVQIEALKSGDLRLYIPDAKGIKLFALHANVNEDIVQQQPGTISGEANSKTDDYWVITLKYPIKVGDTINYWAVVIHNRVGYYKLSSFLVTAVLDDFTPLVSAECTRGSTTIDGGKSTCLGRLIIEDDFNGPSIATSKWIVEHRIPTYTGPNYEFNAYKNRDDVRFIRNGVLFLKPKPLQREDEVRGVLDLTNGCTSNHPEECSYRQVSSFILPPVISAKIRSKVSFKYGKIEIRAKLPFGDWIYPILELEPKDKSEGENSPKIWIAYSRGNDHLTAADGNDIGSRLLFGGPVVHPIEPARSRALASQKASVPYSNDFHVYTLEWIPGKMLLYVDSTLYGEIPTTQGFADPNNGIGNRWSGSDAPFNKEYILSLGVAVGGINDFPEGFNSGNEEKPWSNGDRNYIKNFFGARHVWSQTWKGDRPALQVDYVKVTAV